MIVTLRFLVVVIAATLVGSSKAYFMAQPQPIKSLADLAQSQVGQALDFVIQASHVKDTPLYLQGLSLVLKDKIQQTTKKIAVGRSTKSTVASNIHDATCEDHKYLQKHVSLPVANGPCPKLSSGAFDVQVLHNPYFVGMKGQEEVQVDSDQDDNVYKPSWELVWRNDSPFGSLICGFQVPHAYQRGKAVLQEGPLYISFSCWTQESLADMQVRKEDVIKRSDELIIQRDEELEKFQQTSNPLMKLMHYQRAANLVERLWLTDHKRFRNDIPDDTDVVSIGGGLLLSKKGTVWTHKSHSFPFATTLKMNKQARLLGTVYLKTHIDKEGVTDKVKE